MVSAGESSGTLGSILDRLADLLERQAQVRGKVLSALAYPIVLSFVAAFVVFALMIYVVPKVVEQFQDVGQELPLLTRVVIGLSTSWPIGGGRCSRSAADGLPVRAGRCGRRICGLASTASCCGCPCWAAAARPARGAAGADACRRWWRAGCRCWRGCG
jgi:hypothetical protein